MACIDDDIQDIDPKEANMFFLNALEDINKYLVIFLSLETTETV